MSSRSDIPRRLTYTCHCGWIDIGHLQSVESHRNRYASAAYLWKDILHERGLQIGGRNDSHLIQYRQSMGKFGLTREFAKFYLVRRGLSLSQKRSVALAIFMEVSLGFESLQASMSLLTDSGFSQEDLVSNLIGFYIAVHGALDWRTLCRPVSTEASLAVWDANGPVGQHKNQVFSPQFHDCEECRARHRVHVPQFPAAFQSIQPAAKGLYFSEPEDAQLPVPRHMLSTLFP
jgi:hypothetical protein